MLPTSVPATVGPVARDEPPAGPGVWGKIVQWSMKVWSRMRNRDDLPMTAAGHQIDVLVMDFSKAFDKVGHMRLLRKIASYGIRGRTLKWIESFLANRTQVVVVDGEGCRPVPVTSGVPQGLVLGPCLFLLYINDLAQDLDSIVRLFEDDTIAYLTIDNQADAMYLKHDLDRLADWEKCWQSSTLKNARFSESPKRPKHPPSVTTTYYMDIHLRLWTMSNTLVLPYQATSSGMSTHHQQSKLYTSCPEAQLRVSSQSLKTAAYKVLVRPHAEYCSTVWDPPTAHLTRKVEMVQRRSARWVCNKYSTGLNTTGPTGMIRTLGWPSLESHRKVTSLCLIYKMRNNFFRISYRTLLEPYSYRTKTMPPPLPPRTTTSRQNSQETILCHHSVSSPHSLWLELTPT